jgi:hypothetical protein
MTPQALRCLMFLEASTFVAAAPIHRGLLISGYQHQEAATAESVIALVLIAGGVATWLRQGSARRHGLVAQTFALVGTLVGIFTIAIGVGPRTLPDVAYHVGIMIALLFGVVAVARRPVTVP